MTGISILLCAAQLLANGDMEAMVGKSVAAWPCSRASRASGSIWSRLQSCCASRKGAVK